MKRETLSVALVCALGALVGYFVSSEIATRLEYGSYFAWIGMILGGLTSYCTIDFRRFANGIARAWHTTIGWRPNGTYWKFVLAAILMIFSTFMSWIIIGVYGITYLAATPASQNTSFLGVGAVTGAAGMFLLLTLVLRGLAESNENLEFVRSGLLWLAKTTNPLGAVFYTIRSLLIAARWTFATLVPNLPKWSARVGAALWSFATTAFVFVHSKRRTICFVAASIGAGVGFLCGSAIIGATTGAILGVVQFELVSIRWLKLVSARAG